MHPSVIHPTGDVSDPKLDDHYYSYNDAAKEEDNYASSYEVARYHDAPLHAKAHGYYNGEKEENETENSQYYYASAAEAQRYHHDPVHAHGYYNGEEGQESNVYRNPHQQYEYMHHMPEYAHRFEDRFYANGETGQSSNQYAHASAEGHWHQPRIPYGHFKHHLETEAT